MVTTEALKIQLTEKLDRKIAKGSKDRNAKKSKYQSNNTTKQYPPGVKYHMYKAFMDDNQSSSKNRWKDIFGLMGMQKGKEQNMISQLLDSHFL